MMASGILHVYHPSRNLNLFEHLPSSPTRTAPSSAYTVIQPPKHVLLFIGGLYDTFNLPHYVSDLSRLFPISFNNQHQKQQPWRIMHVQLSSNGRSWGIFSIDRDIEEIATAIDFIRTKLYSTNTTNNITTTTSSSSTTDTDINIVLMGHSTGCQDIMRYLTAPNPLRPRSILRPTVQGAILQAPVSDRDSVVHAIHDEDAPEIRKAYDAAMEIVTVTAEKDRRDVVLPMNLTRPLFGPAPVCVERFLSLVSPDSPARPSAEDFFSHDLSDETLSRTFGAVGRNGLLRPLSLSPQQRSQEQEQELRELNTDMNGGSTAPSSLLVLMSDSDEHVRPHVSQHELLARWKRALSSESGCTLDVDSDVILNAIHDVGGTDWPSQEARLVRLRAAVLNYLDRCVGGVTAEAWDVWNQDKESVMTLKRNDGRDIDKQVGVLKL